jgi:predicted nucleotidyltransferase
MGERYVVSNGVNAAKRGLRESSPYYKDVKFKVIGSSDVLVVLPKEPVNETNEEFSKWFDKAWKNDFGY